MYATVKAKEFSGHGHRLGNLLPCCKPCNSKKGNKPWRTFLKEQRLDDPDRVQIIEQYLQKHRVIDTIPKDLAELDAMRKLRCEVLSLLAKADQVAQKIREKAQTVSQAGV